MKSTEIIPFSNDQFGEIRTVTDERGEPWFVATDIAKALGYSVASAMTRTLDDDEKGMHNLHTLGGNQEVSVISEAGLYSAILRSRIPEAKAFRRWVTHEVLPAIRAHGGYLTPAKVEEALLNPDTLIHLATQLKTERAARARLEERVEADAPKVAFADAVAASKQSILIGELAKYLTQNGVPLGQNKLFARLREDGLLRKDKGGWNLPTRRAEELRLFEVKETAIPHSDGHVTLHRTTKVTGKGQQYLLNRYLKGAAA